MRVRYQLLAALLVLAPPAAAQNLPDNFFPESLARSADGTLYAGSVVEGGIVRVRPEGAQAEAFVPVGQGGLMSVEGLQVDDAAGRLYACTGDLGVSKTPKAASALLAFDLRNGAHLERWPLPGGGFCNDLAPAPSGGYFVSDTTNPRILHFDPRTERLTVWVEHPLLGGATHNGNGIAVDRGAVYLTTFADGRLLRVPIRRDGSAGVPEVVKLSRALAGADALRVLTPGQLVVFENDIPGGNGRVTLVDLLAQAPRLSVLAEGLDEPTSGVVAGGRLLVLESQFRKLFGAEKGVPPTTFALRSLDLPRDGAETLRLPAGFAYPNGIANANDGTLYVGSVTSGRVLVRSPGQSWRTLSSGSAEIYAGTSLRLDEARGLLWGASPDFLVGGRSARPHRMFALDARTGATRRSLVLPDGGFGNDIALEPDGGVLVTDSRRGRILRLASGAEQFDVIIKDSRLLGPNDIGVAGIARAPDGRLIVGNYGTGRLYAVETGGLREIALPRLIENPDGLTFAPDGSILLLESAIASGEGKVLRVPNPFAHGRRELLTVATGLDSPVNLTLTSDGMWVSEARIRHRLLPEGRSGTAPTEFRLLLIPLTNGEPS